jgi:uncharacterized protein YndB with AHSA1/START domain
MNLSESRASKPRVRFSVAFLALALASLLATGALAQPSVSDPTAAVRARLGLLTRADRDALAPHLDRGPVALVEFNGEAELPAVIFATRVEAPAADVARLLSDPAGFPRFMPALDEVTVRSRGDSMIAYAWTWQTAIFTLRGENVMHVFPGPGTRRDRPYRIESTATAGDLGTGRLVFRVYPDGPSRSLLVLSSRIDLRDANYVTRQLNRGERSINRTINISLACVMVLGTKKEAERLAGRVPSQGVEAPALRRPEVDIDALKFLLFRGDLLFMDMTGERLDQVAVVGRIGRDETRTRAVMTDPTEFGAALVPGSYARVTGESEGALDFEWGIDMPLVGSSGTMRLRDTGSVVEVDATGGALRGGTWRFDTEVYPWGEAVVVGWARFDPAEASWLIKMVVQGNPDFGLGITGGSSVMVIRAIRSRAWRMQVQTARANHLRVVGG